MALETLKDVKTIDGFEVHYHECKNKTQYQCETCDIKCGGFSPDKDKYINIYKNKNLNHIAFLLQNGPIKEVGTNGCQVDTIIEAAKLMLDGLNKQFPCQENKDAISSLNHALQRLYHRKVDRIYRGVEGTNKQ